MKVLELFAGSRSIGKVCDSKGHEVFSSDWKEFDGIDYAVDVMQFKPSEVPFVPDVIWASPPCTTFSVASIGKYWNKDGTPKHEKAKVGMELLMRTILIIEHNSWRNGRFSRSYYWFRFYYFPVHSLDDNCCLVFSHFLFFHFASCDA